MSDSDQDLKFNVLGIDIDDDKEARRVANKLYAVLHDAGYDVEGVAPVLAEDTESE
jgi:hypothetical protein